MWNVHLHRNPETLTTLFSSGRKLLLPSWLLGFSTQGERDSIFTMLNVPTFYIVLQSTLTELSAQSQNLNSLTQQTRVHPVDHNSTGLAQIRISIRFVQRQISTGLAQSRISTNWFFQKSPKFQTPPYRAWRLSHPSLISYLGVLLWHLWLSHPPRASLNTCNHCVHLHVH